MREAGDTAGDAAGDAAGDTAGGAAGPRTQRVVLLLQGPSSFFFSRLGDALAARGARVLRLHLCPGDMLFWRRGGGRLHRGSFADWPDFVRRWMTREGVTDLVLLGDNRPLHRPAADAARDLGVRVHHAELGYFRPDWLTLEPGRGPAFRGARTRSGRWPPPIPRSRRRSGPACIGPASPPTRRWT